MDIEKLRSKNIQRNQDLLRQLNLDSIHESISRDSAAKENGPKRKKPKRAPPQPTRTIPTRRSRRLANTPESQEEDRIREQEAEKERLRQEKLKKLRNSRLQGDFSLHDIVADIRLGNLFHEDKILDIKQEGAKSESKESNETKNDADQRKGIKKESKEEDVVEATEEDPLKHLTTFNELGGICSSLDETKQDGKEINLKQARDSLLKMALSTKVDPRDFKLTHNRITSIYLHLSVENRLVVAGDTSGNLGMWAVDLGSSEDPALSFFKPHGRTISRILEKIGAPHQLVTSSYDGSCRTIDLCKLHSSEVFVIGDEEEPLGISDISVVDENTIYATTLGGLFFKKDLRERAKEIEFLRLHDKKIGGFCVNPNANYQIATASLDRSFRIWDLRNIKKKNSFTEFEENLKAPHLYGSYPSRLSISNVDWNQNNHLVCNGYDDKIQLFDYSGQHGKLDVITEWSNTFRPPEKRKSTEDVPENIQSVQTISHNCQTGRWVSILKARWQKAPLDGFQKFAIANMKRSIDIFSENGDRLVTLSNLDLMTAVPAVIAFHPTQNCIVGGSSSGKVFLFE